MFQLFTFLSGISSNKPLARPASPCCRYPDMSVFQEIGSLSAIASNTSCAVVTSPALT
uniref:Uncharacterized protein n=1 Tax=Arundo donax TaxID=35708 RepID=A0A0A8YVV9_ARUDO